MKLDILEHINCKISNFKVFNYLIARVFFLDLKSVSLQYVLSL